MCIQVFKKWYYNVCIQNRRNVVFSKHLRKWNQKSVCLLSFILSPHLQSKKINSKQSLNCYPSFWISFHMCRSYSNIKKSKRKYYLITIWKKRHFFKLIFVFFLETIEINDTLWNPNVKHHCIPVRTWNRFIYTKQFYVHTNKKIVCSKII